MKTEFKRAYEMLKRENKHRTYIRNKIAFECNVSTPIVYNWMNGTSTVPHLAKPVIARIMNIQVGELFPEPGLELIEK